jgi:predicted nucleotidyltransferase
MTVSQPLPAAATAALQSVLAAHPQVEAATLYGSRAMGRHRPGSDIDLTLEGPELDGRVLARIDSALDDLLLPWRFDLSIRHQLRSVELLDHIARVGVRVYRRATCPPPCFGLARFPKSLGVPGLRLFQPLTPGLRSHPPNLIRVMPAQGSENELGIWNPPAAPGRPHPVPYLP